MRKICLVFVSVLLLVLSSCLSSKYSESKENIISGIVVDSASKGISGVLVQIDKNNFAITDSNGMFVIYENEAPSSKVYVSKKEYVPLEIEVNNQKDCFLQITMHGIKEQTEQILTYLDMGLFEKAKLLLEELQLKCPENFRVQLLNSIQEYMNGDYEAAGMYLQNAKNISQSPVLEEYEKKLISMSSM